MNALYQEELSTVATRAIARPATRAPQLGDTMLALLAKIASEGFSIPAHDYVAYTYVGVTNNVATATYKTGGASGTTVALLTYTYVAAGAADNDDIATITRS